MSDEALDAANLRLVKAEFLVAANSSGVLREALDGAYRLADLSQVSVDDSGKVWGVDDAVQALKEANPFLFTQEKAEPKKIGESSPVYGRKDYGDSASSRYNMVGRNRLRAR